MSSTPPSETPDSQQALQGEIPGPVQPATPPLTPEGDTDLTSPSPLRIRDDVDENGKVKEKELTTENTGDKTDKTKDNTDDEILPTYEESQVSASSAKSDDTGFKDEKSQEMPTSVAKDINASYLASALGIDDMSGHAIAAEMQLFDPSMYHDAPESVSDNNDNNTGHRHYYIAGNSNDYRTDNNARPKPQSQPIFPPRTSSLAAGPFPPRQSAGMPSANPVRSSRSSLPGDPPDAERVVSQQRSAGQQISDSDANINHNKYISPSDALVSPCTQKLAALKMKRFDRACGTGSSSGSASDVGKGNGGDGVVKKLFAEKLDLCIGCGGDIAAGTGISADTDKVPEKDEDSDDLYDVSDDDDEDKKEMKK